jgi:hypothetical protein
MPEAMALYNGVKDKGAATDGPKAVEPESWKKGSN